LKNISGGFGIFCQLGHVGVMDEITMHRFTEALLFLSKLL
jgi:hypothetical protein